MQVFDNDKITTKQTIYLLINATIGVGILMLPHTLAQEAGQNGWMLLITGGLFNFIGSYFVAQLAKKSTSMNALDMSDIFFGKAISLLIKIFYFLYFSIITVTVMQIFSEAINNFLLRHTPKEFVVICFILISAYLIRAGVEALARTCYILTPYWVIPCILIYLISISRADFTRLLPLFDIPIEKFFTGSYKALFSLVGFEILLLIGPNLKNPNKTVKIVLLSNLSTVIFYIFSTIMVFSCLGLEEAKIFKWPCFELSKRIIVPGEILERIDALAISLWIITVFTTISSYYFAASTCLKSLLRLEELGLSVDMVFPIIFLLSSIPKNMEEIEVWLSFAEMLTLPACFIIPFVYYILLKIKKT